MKMLIIDFIQVFVSIEIIVNALGVLAAIFLIMGTIKVLFYKNYFNEKK